MRSSTADVMVTLQAPKIMSLEESLEYIGDDELVEITPDAIRLRKKYLTNLDRRRHMREVNKETNKG